MKIDFKGFLGNEYQKEVFCVPRGEIDKYFNGIDDSYMKINPNTSVSIKRSLIRTLIRKCFKY